MENPCFFRVMISLIFSLCKQKRYSLEILLLIFTLQESLSPIQLLSITNLQVVPVS